MDIMTAITTVGFPIVCAVVMGWFIFKIYTNTTQQNKEAMEQLQARCAEREERLYQQLEKNQELNAKAMATLALYADKLEHIQEDVKIIKNKLV